MRFTSIYGSAVALIAAAGASAFQSSLPGQYGARPNVHQCGMSTIDLRPSSSGRDVSSMEEWARGYGVQTAPGVELTSQDRQDYGVSTSQNIPAGSPVMFVPAQLVLSSSAIQQEFAGSLEASEQLLTQVGATNRLPLFRLMVKVLAEYEKGDQSPYFPWLNSMPRLFYNGVSMSGENAMHQVCNSYEYLHLVACTSSHPSFCIFIPCNYFAPSISDACFECLPPYVAGLAAKERQNFGYFFDALNRGNPPLSPQTAGNEEVVKWAYNVALTRHQIVVAAVEKKISPLVDMFNHGTNPNVEITYDGEGNCMANAIYDIAAGSLLTVSLGDPTNPSPMFAKYGFLDDDSPAIFCKAVNHVEEMEDLGYGFKDVLFGTETGEISPQVWDLFLYKLLKDNNDENTANLLMAVKNNDDASKQQLAQQYFPYTLEALKEHVDSTLRLVDQLIMKANSYDRHTHPRVPVIVAHNELVKETFEKVQAQLYAMG